MDSLLNEIETKENFSINEAFEIYDKCSMLLFENDELGQKLLIYILNFKNKFPQELNDMLSDLIEAYGFYPYLEKENLMLSSTSSNIRKYYNKSGNLENKFFHDEQKNILNLIDLGRNIVLSAPTSFGKSLLIEEIIASNKYNNIVVIQPTLALLDETRKKLQKYSLNYQIIIKTSQEPKEKNIFLFTAERVTEYAFFTNLKVDFLIIDEFYKLSSKRDDGRSVALNNAFLKILKHKCQFYLLGPNIEGISDGFAEKYNAVFIKTHTNLVVPKIHDIYRNFPKKITSTQKEDELFHLLSEKLFGEPTLVYCSSPNRAYKLAKKYIIFLKSKKIDEYKSQYNDELIEWININLSTEWSLTSILKYRVGIHDGSMPKHILTSILNSFNKQELQIIFCTSTIIEGVNTVAKNVVYFDKTKGLRKEIDFFDYSNMKGRAGRLMYHYIGNVYNFNEIPKEEKIIVDIPFYEQHDIQKEILINIDEVDVKDKVSEQYIFINNLTISEKELFIKNGINIDGQYKLLQFFRENFTEQKNLIVWHNFPNKEQRKFFTQLIWNFLFEDSDKKFFKNNLNLFDVPLSIYMYHKNIMHLISEEIKHQEKNRPTTLNIDEIDNIIIEKFKFLRTYMQFKIPKLLSTVNEIQNFVALEKRIQSGDYSQYIKMMENDFIQENLVILSEYGIPKTALIKLKHYIPETLTHDEILKEILKIQSNENLNLIAYEKTKIHELLDDMKLINKE